MNHNTVGEIDPVLEIVRIREELFEKYGGIKGYARHIKETWTPSRLEKEGWRVVAPEELEALKHRHHETLMPRKKGNFPVDCERGQRD